MIAVKAYARALARLVKYAVITAGILAVWWVPATIGWVATDNPKWFGYVAGVEVCIAIFLILGALLEGNWNHDGSWGGWKR